MVSIDRRSFLLGGAALTGSLAIPAALHAQEPPTASPIPPVANSDQFNVLFIRHAQSVVNVAPDPDIPDEGVSYPLTQLGIEQVAQLVTTLANVDFSAIYTSTRVRCIQTATGLALSHNLTINLAPELVEADFGELGISAALVTGVMAAWALGDKEAKIEGGESLQDQLDRFIPFVTDTIAQYQDQPKTLVFVAHAAILIDCLPYVFTNVSPGFALANGLLNTGIASGAFVDGDLVCTSWQGLAPQ
jgi:probable phosphoglycerate mutase